MNGQELAQLFIERMGDWKLEWEVLWITFQALIDDFKVKEEDLLSALLEGFREWDL